MLSVKSPPKYLLCPISQEVFEDPVSTADGHTYEKKAIENWLFNHCTSPITGLPLSDKCLRPNFAIKMAVQSYRDVLEALGIKSTPQLTSTPLRDLYKTVYGPQFAVPFQDITDEKLNQLRSKAESALALSSFNLKYV